MSSTEVPPPEPPKKKPPRPGPPPPPPRVGAAAAIVRAAVSATLGVPLGGVCGPIQPTWVTEPHTGKLTIQLKGAADVPSDDTATQRVLLDRVLAVANAIVVRDTPLVRCAFTRSAAEAKYGGAMYDTGQEGAAKKAGAGGADDMLELAWLAAGSGAAADGAAALLCLSGADAPLCASTGMVGLLEFEYDEKNPKKQTGFVLGRKCEVNIKFRLTAAPDEPSALAAAGAAPPSDEVAQFNSATVTLVGALAAKAVVSSAEEAPAEDEGAAAAAEAEGEEEEECVVDPWKVAGKIDYNKLIEQFGSTPLDAQLLARLEKLVLAGGHVTRMHRFLRRGIFFSHRDLDRICTCAEQGKPFYLYTGRGPSSTAMHVGHMVPFMMTQWLQKALGVPLVIQMTDDEKFLWKGKYEDESGDNLMHYHRLAIENARDIIACGFDRSKTFIFSDLDYVGTMYPNIVRIWKAVTYSTARAMFGFVGESNIGQSAFPAVQAAPSFPSSFPVPLRGDPNLACLIPCAIDQDPYFRMTRDVAHKLVPKSHPLRGKPALLHSKFFPPLQGAAGKMSSSDDSSAVFLTDTPEGISDKVKTHAFSGGRMTAKEQRELGADLDKDVSYQWLRFFLEDDNELEAIGASYGSGQGEYWSTSTVKARLITLLQEIVSEHQKRREAISDDEVLAWMAVRPLDF